MPLFVYLDDRDQKIYPVVTNNKAEARKEILNRWGISVGNQRIYAQSEILTMLARIEGELKREGDIND